MNFKNLAMWGIIVILTIGLYNMFKNPQGSISQKNKIIFSEFLTEVDSGRVVKVEPEKMLINHHIASQPRIEKPCVGHDVEAQHDQRAGQNGSRQHHENAGAEHGPAVHR